MLAGFMGKMGSGKTLWMSVLASYISKLSGLPIYANYNLRGAKRLYTLEDLWAVDKGIICFDEAWITLDSRNFGKNVDLTHWINQTRKKQLLVLYSTQHISQIEMRMRKGTDFLFYTFRRGSSFNAQVVDYQYGQLGRKLSLASPKPFFDLYNTFELVTVLGAVAPP